MNIVFIHTRFPGPFGILAQVSGKDKNNHVVFISSISEKQGRKIPGVDTLFFSPVPKGKHKDIHSPEIRLGPAVATMLAGLKKQKFKPDLIIGHSGSGATFHVKDVFPDTSFLGFFDWFHCIDPVQKRLYTAVGSDLKIRMDMRNFNLGILSDLCACDHGICPTAWQKSRFPELFHRKLSVVHPGIDTRVFKPLTDPSVSIDLPDLSDAAHVITCTVNFSLRDTEFQLFMTSLSSVLKHKPGAHVIVIESEWVHADYAGYDVVAPQLIKAKICDTFGLNPGHIHFPETMIHDHYIKLLQASNIHVCLDSPMMISYSMLQAMSCECIVIAPDTPPAREIITDGNNGILADFSTPDNMGRKILACLDYPSFIKPVQKKARQTVVGRFAVEKTLSGYLTIIQNLVRKSYNSHFG